MSWSSKRSAESKQHNRLLNRTAWKRYIRRYRKQHPTCVMCGAPTEHVDHIVEPHGDTRLFWSRRNHQALCRACHVAKTHADKHGKTMKGCDVNGEPFDSSHEWKTVGGEGDPLKKFSSLGAAGPHLP